MGWNFESIGFLYPPDVYMGTFDNPKMQARHEEMKQKKLEALRNSVEAEQDPIRAMMKLHKLDRIPFLRGNSQSFRDAGKYEAAVLTLYSLTNSPFVSGGDPEVWDWLFESCDRENLYALGSPFPFESARVYRIAVTAIQKGLSWTLSRKIIKAFEDRWQEQGVGWGKIYVTEAARKDVLVYLKDRQDEEIILDPQYIKAATILELDLRTDL
jgi:hypothetical protein